MRRWLGCNVDVHPFEQLGEDMRVLECCPKCGSFLATPAIAPTVASAPKPTAAIVVPAATVSSEPADILTMVRDRLAFVNARVEELHRYEAERTMLRKMLDAATADTRAALEN